MLDVRGLEKDDVLFIQVFRGDLVGWWSGLAAALPLVHRDMWLEVGTQAQWLNVGLHLLDSWGVAVKRHGGLCGGNGGLLSNSGMRGADGGRSCGGGLTVCSGVWRTGLICRRNGKSRRSKSTEKLSRSKEKCLIKFWQNTVRKKKTNQ